MTNKFTQYPSWDSRTDKGHQLETKIIWKKYKLFNIQILVH